MVVGGCRGSIHPTIWRQAEMAVTGIAVGGSTSVATSRGSCSCCSCCCFGGACVSCCTVHGVHGRSCGSHGRQLAWQKLVKVWMRAVEWHNCTGYDWMVPSASPTGGNGSVHSSCKLLKLLLRWLLLLLRVGKAAAPGQTE